MSTPRYLLMTVLATALVACGGDPPPPTVATASTPAPRAPGSDFTAAAPVGSAGAGARVHFKPVTRPVAGETVEVALRFTATEAVDRLLASIATEAGVALADDAAGTLALDRMNAGDEHVHALRVTPAAAGVTMLKVTVQTDTTRGSSATDYAVPLIVTAPAAAP